MSPERQGRVPATTLVVDAFPLVGLSQLGEDPIEPPSGLAHLLGALRFVLVRPRVIFALCGIAWLLPLVVALPVAASAERHLAHAQTVPSEGPADLLGPSPEWLFREWQRAGAAELEGASAALLPLILLSSLLGLLVAAGWMDAAVHGRRRHGLRAFLGGGGRMYFPFLRSWLMGLPLFAFWTWLIWGAPGGAALQLLLPEGAEDLASSEEVARRVAFGREIVYFTGILALELWLDLARASLIVGRRSSALLALARGAREGLRRPLSVLTLVGVGLGVELIWIGALRGASLAWGMGPLALGLLLPFGRVVTRGGRLAGLATFVAQSEAAREERRAQRPGPPLPDEYAAL